LLPVPHYHQVFTLPHLLNDLTLCNKRIIYDLFFKAAAYTLNRFSADSRFLNGQMGFFGILHTWERTLSYHVHLHFIITGGGLEPGGRFKRLPYQKNIKSEKATHCFYFECQNKNNETIRLSYLSNSIFFVSITVFALPATRRR
jgi:hypothetical protein